MMRLSAYRKALHEADRLPDLIPELLRYFKCPYSPRQSAITAILNKARADSELLFDGEFVELYQYSQGMTHASSRETATESSSEEAGQQDGQRQQ